MGNVLIGFEDRRKEQLIKERKRDKSYGTYKFHSIIISAINFIFDYSGNFIQITPEEYTGKRNLDLVNLEQRLTQAFNISRRNANICLNENKLILDGNFKFWIGQKTKQIKDFKYKINEDKYMKILKSQYLELEMNDIINITLNNYVESFYRHFNEIEESNKFISKTEARKIAIKTQNKRMLDIFRKEDEYRKKGFNLTFYSEEKDITKWNIQYFKNHNK